MKKWKLGWRLMTPVQKTVFVMLVVCAASALLLPETPYLIRMAGLGAIGAWLVVRPRRGRLPHRPKSAMTDPSRRKPVPRVLAEEEREPRLRSAASAGGLRLVEGRTDRAGALEQMRETVGGFPPERYGAELDAALARIEAARVDVRARRVKRIAEARRLDPLNAVFALYYFNSRHAEHPAEAGLGSIDLYEALGDLYPREQIDEARERSGALIREGWSCAYHPDDNGRQFQQLREHHPGFIDAHLHEAAGWGHLFNR